MRRLYSSLIGWGHYAPDQVLTNDDLAKIVDTSDEWIQSRSGIKQRHIAEDDDFTSTMSAEAARRAMKQAGIGPEDVDLLLIASSSPDYLTPPVSSQVQHQLGLQCGAMTLVVGCTGFVYGLVTADQFIQSGAYRTIVVVGAELISRNLDWEDRTTCVLFGDGAGAVVVQASEQPCGVRAFELGSDGSSHDAIIQWSTGTAEPATKERLDERRQYLRMNGREVFKFATTTMGASLQRVMAKANVTPDDVDLFIPHQANARIIEYAAKQMSLPPEKVVMNVERYGNTSAASVPIALSEALTEGKAKPGDTLAFVAFGAGLTWAATIFDLGTLQAEDEGRAEPAESVINEDGVVEGLIA
ncbi:MAG: ketoacyl-ACP synthase III [Rhodothermaceae bacterium]|nr:ketoacyl-ACP synthase III [Rhodothermaceae bacterium]